jgi:eukaryotic-like serine/threonine-protein kinase
MREHDQDAGHTARSLDRLTGAILDGRYRLDEKIAEGGFGSIYRALDLIMGREVALKVLHRELGTDNSVVERFRREASALAKLRDPHTVTMYDVGETHDGTRYIVMELLRGDSLYELFHASGKRLPWRRVVAIARGVCSSLREAHAVGIVHRDLKPANIHLERHALEADYVKVLDFGIAKMVDANEPNRDLTLAGQMIGTFDYMPPEQMIGGMCTGKSDVFTLGVVLYEMIAGERPYGDAKGPMSALMSMLGTTPVSLVERADVPVALDRIVTRAIQHDPELRPDIFELDAELARIVDHTFDDDAAFGAEDGPTWIEAATPVRITPLRVSSSGGPRVSNATHAPANVMRVSPNATMLGTAPPTITPARGVPISPRTPAKPSVFAVGSRTQIPPAPPTPPVIAPVNVRFVKQSVPPPPQRLPQGTKPIENDAKPDAAWKRQARDAFIRGVVYALLIVIVATTIYFLY